MKKTFNLFLFVCLALSYTVSAFAADPQPAPKKATSAKICLNCHKPEPNAFRGYFDGVAFKSKTIQMKVDEATELFKFDEDEIKVVNTAGKVGDGEFLKGNKVKKGHEIKVEYTEKDGVKTAVKLIEKPPVKLPPEMVINTADMEKLIAQGPEKGKFLLYDSRPAPRFQEAAMPYAKNLPFPAFDKLASQLLPADKSQLVIFYCGGLMCNLSPGSADKAKKLGYTNIKVYTEGMPAWSKNNYGVLSAKFLKDAWIAKDIPHVLLDVRPAAVAETGFIKGAVSFPADKVAKLLKNLPPADKKAPIMIYDANDGVQAAKVAKALLKAKYGKITILTGGFEGWKAASYDVATGKLPVKATYVPKPRPGEIAIDEFKKIAAAPPADVQIIDVRNADEVGSGMFKGAINIPAEELKENVAKIPKDKKIITNCATGVRAEMAYHTLKELGFKDVKFLNAIVEFEKNGKFKITKD